jgi:hypothetical protein
VNGLAKLYRWTDDCLLYRKVFMAPAVVVAYNLFMNSVDRMDQRRSAMACQRREKRCSMSIFTMILDLACSNAYALACTLSTTYKSEVKFGEFKRRIADQLSLPWTLRTRDRADWNQTQESIWQLPWKKTRVIYVYTSCLTTKRETRTRALKRLQTASFACGSRELLRARFLFQNVRPLFFFLFQRLPWAGLGSKELKCRFETSKRNEQKRGR